ncbi:hypothetical protein Golax_025693 [Gossypium laxum]|uniref:Uncharacterized protein n=1 Tax=Gossypium laxum TaxID=34288 RepID=A0A7J9B2J9_9ROSI|nr:hypothetical protein [Gossypium laxum]
MKTDYKRLRLLIRTVGLGKTSEQWREEIQEENDKEDRVIELERSLRQYQNRNSAIELKASLSKIEKMKKRIKELETALRNYEIQIEYLEANESHNNEQLHYL